MSTPVSWVRIGRRTVVDLDALSSFCGDRPPNPGSEVAAVLEVGAGTRFPLDRETAEHVWRAIEQRAAPDGFLPRPAHVPEVSAPAVASADDPGPRVHQGLKPPRPEGRPPEAGGGDEPGVVVAE